MNTLLEKENILYKSVTESETDSGTVSAFHDYATFLSEEGLPLLVHIANEMKERAEGKKEYKKLYEEIVTSIKKDTLGIEKIVKKLGLDKDEMFMDRLRGLHTFLDGNYYASYLTYFDNVRLDYVDILRELYRKKYHKEISKYVILSAGDAPFVDDAVAFRDVKKYYSLRKSFDTKHSRTVVGALIRVLATLSEMNDLESITEHTRGSLIDDTKKVHKSIVLNNLDTIVDKNTSHNQIFFMENNEIHHYEMGILGYEEKSLADPKYIKMFKNIIRYMPLGKKRISVSEFEKLMPKNQRVGDVYKDNLGNSGISFHNFLKRNGVHNVHPKIKKPVIKVTRDYIDFRNIL